MPQQDYSQEQYANDFLSDPVKAGKALEHALDIRKFEIERYWARATYFWAFIGAAFAGFLAIRASAVQDRQDLSVILSCLGLVFSIAWLCVNRGSKHWQENWEKHVDMLEDGITGPLYKVILTRGSPEGWRGKTKHALTGPSLLSVSKINQLISLYVSVLWILLTWHSLRPFDVEAEINWFYVVVVTVSGLACLAFFWLGRTYHGGYWHRATIRTTKIKNG